MAKNIWQKLVAVRSAIPGIAKDAQTSAAGRFKYVSSNQLLGTLRPLLDAEGLLLEVRVTGHNLLDKWRGAANQNEHLTELDIEFVWVNAENPEERIACSWYGQGLDTGEKGVGKAATYAEKYFLLKFFNIPTDEDDPDGHGRPEEARASARRSQRLDDPTPEEPKFNAEGSPTNAAAAEYAEALAQFPGVEAVVDMESFRECMAAVGVKAESSMKKAKDLAGFETHDIEQLDVDGLRTIYAVTLAKKVG